MLKNDITLHFCKVSVDILEEAQRVHSAMSLLTKTPFLASFYFFSDFLIELYLLNRFLYLLKS